jgi:peptidoglycan/LPS O-acetylase OafA/YrhL
MNTKKNFNLNLESLRGYAALFVSITHFVDTEASENLSSRLFDAVKPPGLFCVSIFFMLSGYVIGISTKKELSSKSYIISYLKKRLLRLYPIYFISLIMTLIISYQLYTNETIILSFLLIQGMITPVIWQNSPSWSLHYEFLYYLLFVPISYFKLNPLIIFLTSITIGILNYYLTRYYYIPIISSYAFGFSFWVAGLAIARYCIDKGEINYNLLMSNLFLIWSMALLNFNDRYLSHVSLAVIKTNFEFKNVSGNFAQTILAFRHLAWLPYCFIFIANFTGINFKFKKWIIIILQFIPILTLFSLIRDLNNTTIYPLVGHVILFIISIYFLIKAKFKIGESNNFIKFGTWFGSISYAFYIIHHPILFMIHASPLMGKSNISYLLKFIIFFGVVTGLSYFLEKRLQPFVRNKIQGS